jgi:hypothetical protein
MVGTSNNLDHPFAIAMRGIGGQRPSELNPTAVQGENADFIFAQDDVIAELKTLTIDSRDDPEFNDKLLAIYMKWVRQGQVPPPPAGKFMIDTKTLPEPCAREFVRFLTRRIKNDVTKANRQIREVKKLLGMMDAKGIFVLGNAGNPYLTPEVVLWGINDALGTRHSSIQSVIYLTHGLPCRMAEIDGLVELWVDAYRNEHKSVPRAFLDRMRDAWMEFQASRGVTVSAIGARDHELIRTAVHRAAI